jgi:hypothetical protein
MMNKPTVAAKKAPKKNMGFFDEEEESEAP